ncbi:MAG: cysteine desulfurase [Alphaproteobacteria bacterium]|uniref:cysteine desulfurase family protein n=1 Tax=Maricaulis alexandrii TaxID=2570354 RepID=UPI0011098D86|nr:cysteine desulfurase family protein [Maricaulis alexandrii]MCR9266404.1 cysteine desulfurase [Alphaproteobacteria bacterium]
MRIYLDHNATTAVRPSVIELMTEVMGETGNPSSVHGDGQAAQRRVETARRRVGKALCARPEDVIFTGCGTEALNLALHSAIQAGQAGTILHSAIEHEAVAATAAASGLPVMDIPVTADGVADIKALEALLDGWNGDTHGRPVLAMMLVNNEIGTIQPVAEAVRLVKEHDGLAIVDAIQAAGKIPVDFAGLGADYMAISAHKFGGPQGVGALIASCDAPLVRQLHGGGQEKNRRAGTLNVAGIAGLGLALEEAVASLDDFAALASLRDRMEAGLLEAAPDLHLIGKDAPRLPNTIGLACPGWKGETQVMALDLAGFSISAGSACSSGKANGSKIGNAVGLEKDASQGFARVSLGWNSQPDEADAFVTAWIEAVRRARPASKTQTLKAVS